MKLSLIVSTYNRPDALDAVLHGLQLQRGVADAAWEILVADDGSGSETTMVVRRWQAQLGQRLRHIWHEDKGFRLAAIRNRAAAQAKGDYLVFIDGDCVPFPDFIAMHLKLAEPGKSVAGSRILLAEALTAELLASSSPHAPALWSKWEWLKAWLGKDVNKAFGWLRMDLGGWRDRKASDWRVYRGCNFAVWARDYVLLDGMDEAFSGWGYEDSDFAVRLLRAGVRIKDGRFAVPVLHLWHRENDRSRQLENWQRFEASLNGTHIRATRGLSSLDQTVPAEVIHE